MECLGRKLPLASPRERNREGGERRGQDKTPVYMYINSFSATCDLHCEVHVVAVARQKTAHTTLNTSTNLIQPSLYICM